MKKINDAFTELFIMILRNWTRKAIDNWDYITQGTEYRNDKYLFSSKDVFLSKANYLIDYLRSRRYYSYDENPFISSPLSYILSTFLINFDCREDAPSPLFSSEADIEYQLKSYEYSRHQTLEYKNFFTVFCPHCDSIEYVNYRRVHMMQHCPTCGRKFSLNLFDIIDAHKKGDVEKFCRKTKQTERIRIDNPFSVNFMKDITWINSDNQ